MTEHVYSPEENLASKVKETIKKNMALKQEFKIESLAIWK